MRGIDRRECEAAGRTPKRALRDGWRSSSWCLTALYDGRPAAIFGVCATNAVLGVAAPWMLCTDDARHGARAVMVMGDGMVRAMLDDWRMLKNYVGAENRIAIRLLDYLGFTVEPETVIVGGMEMRLFWRGRDV